MNEIENSPTTQAADPGNELAPLRDITVADAILLWGEDAPIVAQLRAEAAQAQEAGRATA